IAEKRTEKQKGMFDKFKEAKGDKDKFKEIFEGMQKDEAEFKKQTEEVLTADQKKRLKQIAVQQMELRIFGDPEAKPKGMGGFGGLTDAQRELMKEVQGALKLSDSQKASVKGLNENFNKERTEIFKDAGIGKGMMFDQEKFDAANKKVDKVRK